MKLFAITFKYAARSCDNSTAAEQGLLGFSILISSVNCSIISEFKCFISNPSFPFQSLFVCGSADTNREGYTWRMTWWQQNYLALGYFIPKYNLSNKGILTGWGGGEWRFGACCLAALPRAIQAGVRVLELVQVAGGVSVSHSGCAEC